MDLTGNWNTLRKKYSQKRDIELTMSKTFNFELLYRMLIVFTISLFPGFLLFNIILYNKKIATERAKREERILEMKQERSEFLDLSFGRGSYSKTMLFLGLLYVLAYTGMWGMTQGFFSALMVGFMGCAFYLALFLALYHLPDRAEVDLWKEKKGRASARRKALPGNRRKILDVNAAWVLLVILGIGVIAGVAGGLVSSLHSVFQQPIEPILTTMLVTGVLLLAGGLGFIYWIERAEREDISFSEMDWERYSLTKYQLVKGFAFGSALFLNFFFQWNIWAFYMKFPMTMGPHSAFYLYMVLAVVAFFGGVQLMVRALKEKFLADHLPAERTWEKLAIEFLAACLGGVIIAVVGLIAFYPLLSFSLIGSLVLPLVVLLVGIYAASALVNAFCVERGLLGVVIFLPLTVFAVLAFFLHI